MSDSCPVGTSGNSPAIYRWVAMRESLSPVGTAETFEVTAIQPSLRDCDCNVNFPTDESVGYFQTSLRDYPYVLTQPL